MDTLQNPNEITQPTAKPRGFHITSENAKALQLKARDAKARKKAEQLAMLAKAERDLELVKPLMEKAIAVATGLASVPEAEYRLQRLSRTRAQLEALDKELEGETDTKAIKALCDSIKALSEVERILAGRPLPGSHRPSKASQPQRSAPIEPSE